MKKPILVLDDEEMMRYAIVSALSDSGYDVEQCANGEEGLERLQTVIPQLIVCDVDMPKLDGFGFLREVRKSSKTSDIPFIFLTGETSQASRREGMMLGADDYLTKPFSPDELIKAVEVRLTKHRLMENKLQDRLEEFRKNISLAMPHEIRTPLSGILGFAEFLTQSDGMTIEEAAYIGSHIHKSAKRLHELLERILLLNELESDRVNPARLEEFSTAASDVHGSLAQIIETQGVESERTEDIRLSLVEAHVRMTEVHLARVVNELVSNALKFSSKGLPVEVKATTEADHCIISVEDRGKGMSADQIARIGAYVQFDRDRDEQQGLGLGLALVSKICTLFNGSLSIEASSSGGTKVIVIFPLAE